MSDILDFTSWTESEADSDAGIGWCNTPELFQVRMQLEVLKPADLFRHPGNGALQLLDDTLLYGSRTDVTLNNVDKFLQQVMRVNLKFNIKDKVIS